MNPGDMELPASDFPAPRIVDSRMGSRRGAAFLVLVVMVLLLVLAATKGLVQTELQSRRGNRDWLRSQTIDAAVTRWRQADLAAPKNSQILILPIGVGDDEYLEVSKNKDSENETLTIRWLRGGNVTGQVIRHTEAKPKGADSMPTREEETQ